MLQNWLDKMVCNSQTNLGVRVLQKYLLIYLRLSLIKDHEPNISIFRSIFKNILFIFVLNRNGNSMKYSVLMTCSFVTVVFYNKKF